tara:strand:+ start:766 stop:1053 length:288 start_codon:yes stop_codon:yes gene_type:complete
MKKSELILRLNNKYPSLKPSDIEKIVGIFFETISKSLSENKKIEIRGFGTFKIKTNKARKARNPKTGEVISVLEKKGIHFKTGKILHKRINAKDN